MILVKVLNLKRRPDRRKWMEETLFVDSELQNLQYIYSADGNSAEYDADEETIRINHHGITFLPERKWELTQDEIGSLRNHWITLGYTAPDENDLRIFYNRSVNTGELACFASHHAAWTAAVSEWKQRDALAMEMGIDNFEEDLLIVLEDDVTAVQCLTPMTYVHHMHWREVRTPTP